MRLKSRLLLMHYSKADVMCTRIQPFGESNFCLYIFNTYIAYIQESLYTAKSLWDFLFFV